MTDRPTPSSAEIRQKFLDFFAGKGHAIVPSDSLVPQSDPTLLFTNAGMNQFKDIFLNLREPEHRRVADAQKVMRVSGKHNDLEDVGRSPYHHTLFEMLGNWSFGDYYKREAISWAWELLTEVWGLPKERLWATVFEDDKGSLGKDEEALDYWRSLTDIRPEQILFFGNKDNFWEMGDTGPCGPCSEIHLDMGPEACDMQHAPGHVCRVNGDCRRYIELWNLVFIQYNRQKHGALVALPSRHVDTGMGFERIVSVLQHARTNYDNDLFLPIIQRTQEMLGASDGDRDAHQVSYRVIADHVRAITFLIGDGVLPANDGRGYVLRLILRRAARHGRMLGFEGPFLGEVAKVVVAMMGAAYPELEQRKEFILATIGQEESRFSQTLVTGLGLLDELIGGLKDRGISVIPGEDAFRLYDTHGFPLDLTQDVARDHGFTVDVAGYEAALSSQKERARASAQFGAVESGQAQVYFELFRALKEKGILGAEGVEHVYDQGTEWKTQLAALVRDGISVSSVQPGESVEVILPATPFYVESGGQVSDVGKVVQLGSGNNKPTWEIRIDGTRRPVPGIISHMGEVVRGAPAVGDPAWAIVDADRRMDIRRNHTATHLLDSELRRFLGRHVHQAGSVVAPDRLRFDFTHTSMLTQDELDALEKTINDEILADYPVLVTQSSYAEAVAEGAIALFTEKYGDRVRVVHIGESDEEVSKELCGGTHVDRTGQLGLFHIVSEESVGAGVRRIEAVTGRAAQALVQSHLKTLDQTAAFLRVPADHVDRTVKDIYAELQSTQKEVLRLKARMAFQHTDRLASEALKIGPASVVAAEVKDADVQTLREMSDRLRELLGSAVIVLGSGIDGKPQLIAAVTDDLAASGMNAGQLVKAVAKVVGGGGGGKATLAQAGGRDMDRLQEALSTVPMLVAAQLGVEL